MVSLIGTYTSTAFGPYFVHLRDCPAIQVHDLQVSYFLTAGHLQEPGMTDTAGSEASWLMKLKSRCLRHFHIIALSVIAEVGFVRFKACWCLAGDSQPRAPCDLPRWRS